MRKIKVGMIQMKVVFDQAEENLRHADELVKKAASLGAQICIIPECADLGWGNPDTAKLAQPVPGTVSEAYGEIAKKYHVYLVAGLTEKEGTKVYNTAVLLSDQGELLHKHRKINILTGVEDVYSVGTKIEVIDTPFGRIGIDICADNAVQSLSIGHVLARMGAQMILSPCAWAVEPDRDPVKEPYGEEWHVPYEALSSLYEIPVIGVSNVGEVSKGSWKGWKAIGNSIAYDSDGEKLAVLPYGEEAEMVQVVNATILEPAMSGTKLSEFVYESLMQE